MSADALSAAEAQGAPLLGVDPAGLAAAVVLQAVEQSPRGPDAGMRAMVADLAARLVPTGERRVVLDLGPDLPGCEAVTGPEAVTLGRHPGGAGQLEWVRSRNRASSVRGALPPGERGPVCGNALPVVGAAVPIRDSGGRAVGTLEVYGPAGVHVDAAEFAALRRIAGLAALLVAAADRSAEQGRWIVQAQETERARLAADIHDGIAQQLVGLLFHLDAGAQAIGGDPVFAAEQVGRAQVLAQLAAAETRAAIGGLRPPALDDLGLPAALLGLARDQHDVHVDTSRVVCAHPMAAPVQTTLYRIAQEALRNVSRHAQAGTALLALDCSPREVRLRVSDDGVGLGPDRPAGDQTGGHAFGLTAMRERATAAGGTLEVRSRRGGGTTVEVVLRPGHPRERPLGRDQPDSVRR